MLLFWMQLEGVQPAVTLDDVIDVEKMVKGNKEFQDFMARRYGITSMDEVAVDPWCAVDVGGGAAVSRQH